MAVSHSVGNRVGLHGASHAPSGQFRWRAALSAIRGRWWCEVLPVPKEEAVAITVADLTAAPIPRSQLTVRHLRGGVGGHRVRIPVEVHPYWSGVYGGAAGAVAMAAVALLFGLIAQRSIWYPINLLAAGILPSLGGAPIEQLRQFSAAGLVAGAIIHGAISLLSECCTRSACQCSRAERHGAAA